MGRSTHIYKLSLSSWSAETITFPYQIVFCVIFNRYVITFPARLDRLSVTLKSQESHNVLGKHLEWIDTQLNANISRSLLL